MANSCALLAKLAAITFICMLANSPQGTNAQISCDTVASKLYPCLAYIETGRLAPRPTSPCCRGISYLMKVGKTKTTRQGICTCLNKVNADLTNAEIGRASRLRRSCRLPIPFTIKRNADCSRVK